MPKKLSDRDVIRRALYDAIGWASGFADSNKAGSPERAEAEARVESYRALLRKKYGENGLTPMEDALDGPGVWSVSIYDLMDRKD